MMTQVAFLFPGQGSQAVGMGADIWEASAAARQVFESADEATGISLSNLCFHGPDDVLRETIHTQPAIVAVSLALLAALQEALTEYTSSWSSPLTPSFTAGHSVGEYAALVASGALDLKDAVRLVRERAGDLDELRSRSIRRGPGRSLHVRHRHRVAGAIDGQRRDRARQRHRPRASHRGLRSLDER